MEWLLIIVFVLGYLAIAFEHSLKIDKASASLILGVSIWTLIILGGYHLISAEQTGFRIFTEGLSIQHKLDPAADTEHLKHLYVEHGLLELVGEVAQILFFLIGAMAIVEVVDLHNGFRVITDRITTTNAVKLLWLLSFITFFLSAALDNLTTTIVMVSLLRKLIEDQHKRWFFAGMLIIAANAGGAWSPIGDVTTTMLWIDGQISEVHIMKELLLPSLVSMIVPLAVLSFILKGELKRPVFADIPGFQHQRPDLTPRQSMAIFVVGVGCLLFVPLFKILTHLPPFMGMLLSLGVLWIVTELMHKRNEHGHMLSVISGLRRVDMASVLFFLGILLAIGGLQLVGILSDLALYLDSYVSNIYVLNLIIGALSAIVDNVPLVAAAQGMYEITASGPYAIDGSFWTMLAFCAGTGGSMLIIGSAAGVAAMGLEKIHFGWYLKHISWLALLGYLAGAGVFVLMQ